MIQSDVLFFFIYIILILVYLYDFYYLNKVIQVLHRVKKVTIAIMRHLQGKTIHTLMAASPLVSCKDNAFQILCPHLFDHVPWPTVGLHVRYVCERVDTSLKNASIQKVRVQCNRKCHTVNPSLAFL